MLNRFVVAYVFLPAAIVITVLHATIETRAQEYSEIQKGEILAFVKAKKEFEAVQKKYIPIILSSTSSQALGKMAIEKKQEESKVFENFSNLTFDRYKEIILISEASKSIRTIIEAAENL